MNSKIVLIGIILLVFSIATFFIGANEWFTTNNEFNLQSINFFNDVSKLALLIAVILSPILIMIGLSSKGKSTPLIKNGKRICPMCSCDIPMNTVTCPSCGRNFFLEVW